MWAVRNNKKFTILTWEKPLSILNRNRFSQNLEYVVRIYDKGTALNLLDLDNFPDKKNYYSKNRKLNSPTKKIHPTQKPIEYLLGLIELCTNEGDLVLDTFFGSGQTGKACQMLNRNFIGMEKEEEFVDKAKNYLEIL
jgi:DNA modification methylase